MPAGTSGEATEPEGRRARFRGLTTRIVVSVFSAALVTGVAVTWISTRSTEQFLRQKIDERFPELLRARALGLETWFAQRELDLSTFAASTTVVRGLEAGAANRAELVNYLTYVRENFPQYSRLMVLDTRGVERVGVGRKLELPEFLRLGLAGVEASAVGDFFPLADGRFQAISSPIERNGERIGTLHALVEVAALQDLLAPGEAADTGVGLYLIGSDSIVMVASRGAPERSRFERSPAAGDAPLRVEEYDTPSGAHVVGTAMAVGPWGWKLAVEQEYDVAFAPVMRVVREVLAINIGIVLLFGLIAGTIARSIARPIHELSERARQIAQGETDVEIPQTGRGDEIGVLSRALHEMVERLNHNQVQLQGNKDEIERAYAELTRTNEELHRNNEILEQLSFTDGLTRLHNHRYFQDRLRLEAKRADRNQEALALLLVDIDDFKALNDQHGHAVGDEVLRRVGAVMNRVVRETDLPARYGGEEFAVLAPRTDVEGAAVLGEKLREGMDALRVRVGEGPAAEELGVTVSIGVAIYRGDPRQLFVEADRALYRAKDRGKDCVVIYEEGREV